MTEQELKAIEETIKSMKVLIIELRNIQERTEEIRAQVTTDMRRLIRLLPTDESVNELFKQKLVQENT